MEHAFSTEKFPTGNSLEFSSLIPKKRANAIYIPTGILEILGEWKAANLNGLLHI